MWKSSLMLRSSKALSCVDMVTSLTCSRVGYRGWCYPCGGQTRCETSALGRSHSRGSPRSCLPPSSGPPVHPQPGGKKARVKRCKTNLKPCVSVLMVASYFFSTGHARVSPHPVFIQNGALVFIIEAIKQLT